MASQAELGGGRGAGAKKSGYSPRSTRASSREKIVAEPHAASQNAVTSVDSNAWGAVLPWEQKCIWRTATYDTLLAGRRGVNTGPCAQDGSQDARLPVSDSEMHQADCVIPGSIQL